MKVFTGRSNPGLAQGISNYLDIPLGKIDIQEFSDGTALKLTTARYFTPNGRDIHTEGIEPDIIVEQGTFESLEFNRISESDLKGSLDKNNDENLDKEEALTPQEERLQIDFQLARAIDLVKGLGIYEKSFNE